jgi:hypothetical protein
MSSSISTLASLSRDAFFINVQVVATTDFLSATGSTFSPAPTANTAIGSVLLRDMGKTIRTPAQGPTSGNQLILRKVVVVTPASNSANNEGDAVASLPVYINLRDGRWARV